MKVVLTAKFIEALKPKPTAYYVGDAKQDGLRIRVAVDGKLTWNVTTRIKGSGLVSTSLGRCDPIGRDGVDLASARDRAASIVKAARSGKNLIAIERAAFSAAENLVKVSTLIEEYCREISSTSRKGGPLRTAEDIRRRLERALSAKLSEPAQSITRRDISLILDQIAFKYPREAEKRRQVIGAAFNWAVAKGYIDKNPLSDLPSYGSSTLSDRVLNRNEIFDLWQWLESGADQMPLDVIAVLKLQILTGARVGEVGGMEANELIVEDDQLIWILPASRSKNKRVHVRPLLGLARGIALAALQARKVGPLFRIANEERALRADDVGLALNHRTRPIAHFTTHDIRRTVVSALDELGVPLDTIAAVVGHQRGGKDTRTLVRHYSRPILDGRIKDALIIWDLHLNGVIAKKDT